MATNKNTRDLRGRIVSQLVRRHSTAAVLFHHAIAERLGLGATDHKCFDLLQERGAMTGSDLAAITGLTSGAITGVVARLEQAGYVRREPDPKDGRKQILRPVQGRMREFHELFADIRSDLATLLERFDAAQLTAIGAFLSGTTDLVYRQVALLRAHPMSPPTRTAPSRNKRRSAR